VRECPELPDLFADNTTYRCVLRCPDDFWASNITTTGVTNRECVSMCPIDPTGKYYYADNHTGRCVLNCPINLMTYSDKVSRRCVAVCPEVGINGVRTYADDSTKRCV
jgi:hypothetical protein